MVFYIIAHNNAYYKVLFIICIMYLGILVKD